MLSTNTYIIEKNVYHWQEYPQQKIAQKSHIPTSFHPDNGLSMYFGLFQWSISISSRKK
jgi:hypothetical protein